MASFNDRDVASRDTVYRKPERKAAPAKDGGKAAPKKAGGGQFNLPRTAPVPTPQPMASATTMPNMPSQLPGLPMELQDTGVPSQLPGLPMELQDTGMQMPDPQMAAVPPALSGNPLGAGRPPFPGGSRTMSPTSVPGPGREELAAVMQHPRALDRLKTFLGM